MNGNGKANGNGHLTQMVSFRVDPKIKVMMDYLATKRGVTASDAYRDAIHNRLREEFGARAVPEEV